MTSQNPVWENNPWQSLHPLQNDDHADVCVIGLGGSGLSCIDELLALGARRVAGIDAASVGGEAAGRNGGFLLCGSAKFYHQSVAHLGRHPAKTLYQKTMRELDRMCEQTPEAIRRAGSLRIASNDAEYADCLAQLEAMRADGLPVEPYAGPEGRGLLFPHDAGFNPLLRCRLLALRVMARGAVLFENTPLVSLEGTRVVTPRGSIQCKAVVVAVDGNLERVLPELNGVTRTARLQMLGTAPAPEVNIPRPVYARWGYEYWQQLPGGEVALGGFRDLGGDEEWTASRQTSAKIQAALEGYLRGALGVSAPVTHRWAASVGYTADGIPVLRETRPNVWAIGGYNGTGNLVGAVYGRAVAQRVMGG